MDREGASGLISPPLLPALLPHLNLKPKGAWLDAGHGAGHNTGAISTNVFGMDCYRLDVAPSDPDHTRRQVDELNEDRFLHAR